MPKPYSEMTLQERIDEWNKGVRINVREYPIIDSDTKSVIPNLVGKYFEMEIDYRFYGEKSIVSPISKYVTSSPP